MLIASFRVCVALCAFIGFSAIIFGIHSWFIFIALHFCFGLDNNFDFFLSFALSFEAGWLS